MKTYVYLKEMLAKRATVRELRAMPNYLLQDVGITRDQIEDFAEGKIMQDTQRSTKRQANGQLPSALRAGCPECCCLV